MTALEAALPVKDWQRLVQVEPSLRSLEILCNGHWSREAADILCGLVGWYRMQEAPDFLTPSPIPPSMSICLSDVVMPVKASPPQTETERWLRTSAAFDMARDHLDGLGDCRCPVHRRGRVLKGGHEG
jgi:hypothetical protein